MAKRRNSAALFEVFHDTRGPASAVSPVASVFSGFRSWLKARSERSALGVVDPNDPTTLPIRSPLTSPRQLADEASGRQLGPQLAAQRLDAASASLQKSVPVADVPRAADAAPSAHLCAQPSQGRADLPAASHWHSHVRFDRDQRAVTLHLRLNTAVVVCFGILLSVALAYVLGRRTGTKPTVLAASVQADPNGIEVQPRALDLPRRTAHLPTVTGTGTGTGTGSPSVKPPRAPERHESAPVTNPPRNSPHADPPAPVEDDRRTIGLNYLIIFGGPSEADAAEARDFFVRKGVPCTVETKLVPAGVSGHAFMVVTREGFERLSLPEYKKLLQKVEQLESQVPANMRNKKFFAQAFKLKE